MKNIYFIQANSVYGNNRRSVYLPYASGCIAAYAFSDEKIKSEYSFGGFIYTHEKIASAVEKLGNPYIAAFSCSIWNYEYSKALAAALKEKYPEVIIVFGGHNISPGFETFNDCPAADILIYREGEQAFKNILFALADGNPLDSVSNIAFRRNGEYIKTKEEAVCLSEYPSPYLNGIFDSVFDGETSFSAILETNRGCPFRCAFCDWGALGTKVRLFPMERIKAELDWIAAHSIEYVYCADGNFGLFDRDEEVANYIISLKKATGFPQNFRVCFTKNRTDFVKKICMKFNEHGLDKAQTLSFQSLSPTVLESIGRKNISLEHFRELMNEYSRCGISTSSELILGLPGETRESFTEGLCALLEYGQHKAIQVYPCDLLPNSEMGSKEFVEKHGIETVKTPFAQAHCPTDASRETVELSNSVIKTSSMSTEDWVYCVVFSCIIQAFHNIGFFRAAAIYSRYEYGISYKEFYSRLSEFAADPENKACHAVYSLIKGFAEGMAKGENSWAVPCEPLGDICWQFDELYFLKSLENADAVYYELENFVFSLIGKNEESTSLIDYQRNVIKRVSDKKTHKIICEYDFYSYFKRIYEGSYAPLEKKKTTMEITDEKPCNDLYTYACHVVWYGRNKSVALYSSDYYQIKW